MGRRTDGADDDRHRRHPVHERVPTGPERRAWLLLVDPLPNRIFFDCGIVDALRRGARRPADRRLARPQEAHPAVARPYRGHAAPHEGRAAAVEVTASRAGRAAARPRARPAHRLLPAGHPPQPAPRLPRGTVGLRAPQLPALRTGRATARAGASSKGRWHAGTSRRGAATCPRPCSNGCARSASGLVVTNLQARVSMPFLPPPDASGCRSSATSPAGTTRSARASLSPHLDRYVVQNETMRADLERFHGIAGAGRRHRLAAVRRLLSPSAAGRIRRAAPAARARPEAVRSSSTPGTRRRTSPTRRTSSSGSWTGGASGGRRAVPAPLPAASRATASSRNASPPRSTEPGSPCRRRATRTSTISRPCCSTSPAWSRTPARSCSTASSTTDRSSASPSTRARLPASAGPTSTSAASTTAS